MTCRNELKGIAAGIAGKFVSRNNDLNGFWAMGLLYSAASKGATTRLTLNLLSGESLEKSSPIAQVAETFRAYLRRQLQNRGFEEHQVAAAMVELEFDVAPTQRHLVAKNTWGEPFICRVVLTDDLYKKHTYEIVGWCGKHAPAVELRRA